MQKRKYAVNLFFAVPVFILIMMLLFINYAVYYFRDTAYYFMYETNVDSVGRFQKELDELLKAGYSSEEYTSLYNSMIHIYSKTLGEKYAVVTVLIDENNRIVYSNEENQRYVEAVLNNTKNMELFQQSLRNKGEGEFQITHRDRTETVYYKNFSNERYEYQLYMSIDRFLIEKELNADRIILPICMIGILLIVLLEYMIWLRRFNKPKPGIEEVLIQAVPQTGDKYED